MANGRTCESGSWRWCSCFLPILLAAPGAIAQGETTPGRVVIRPSLVKLAPGHEQQFRVVMWATRLTAAKVMTDVKWSVNDIRGGSEQFGTISSGGLYRAPATAPVPREIHICAEVEGAANRYVWATVLMDAPGTPYSLEETWGEPKENAQYLVDPHCVCLDKDGNLIIADYYGSRVVRFSAKGAFLGDVGLGTGEGPGQVMLPRVVQVDPDGNIFVSDQKSDKPRIQVFSPKGEFLRMFAEKGHRPGQMLRAHGLAFDSRRRLHVVDVDTMRINVYDHSGQFIRSWGQDGPRLEDFNAPHGIVIDRNDDVFVVGYYGPCQKFTAEGDFLFAFAHGDPPDGPVYFHSIAIDWWGNVYLTVRGAGGYGGAIEETGENRVSIMKYNNNGDYVCGLTLSVGAHKENWVAVSPSGVIYAIYEGFDRLGMEVFVPR